MKEDVLKAPSLLPRTLELLEFAKHTGHIYLQINMTYDVHSSIVQAIRCYSTPVYRDSKTSVLFGLLLIDIEQLNRRAFFEKKEN